MWLSTNYVRHDKFYDFIEKQTKADEQQDDNSKSRFELTQTKLETIINQQVAYAEQIKTLNSMLMSYQKQVEALHDRILYLERNQRSYQ